jgi:MoaA/NifB/PqqE/SkfB family radical SAM enzyme
MFNILTLDKVRKIEVESTSYCNAGCPLCSRHKFGTSVLDDITLTHINPELIYKLKDDFGEQTNIMDIWYVGNLGDSLMHPQIEDIWKFTAENFSYTEMETNGGTRKVDFWKNMGEISKINGNANMVFSIDGLEDTNEIYRKKVNWDRLMENVQAYIGAGGTAIWKWITFEHNEHQIDEAKEFAKKLGFIKFESIITTRVESKAVRAYPKAFDHSVFKGKKVDTDIDKVKKMHNVKDIRKNVDVIIKDKLSELKFDTSIPKIDCKYIKQQRMYLNSKGRIWPCCWHSERYDKYSDLRDMDPLLRTGYSEGFNDYNKHSLPTIASSPVWKEMTDAWESLDGMLLCQRKCINKKWEVLCNFKDKNKTEIFS